MKRILLWIIAVLPFWGWACEKLGNRGQPGEARTVSVSEQTSADQPVRVPSEAELDSLLQLQQQIMQQPENPALRRELGRHAIDTHAGLVWVAGKGRLNPQAPSASVAASQAEQAALLDASRWAAYLIEWQKTDYATGFGSIQARVPAGTVVRKLVNDSLCVVLVRIPWRSE